MFKLPIGVVALLGFSCSAFAQAPAPAQPTELMQPAPKAEKKVKKVTKRAAKKAAKKTMRYETRTEPAPAPGPAAK